MYDTWRSSSDHRSRSREHRTPSPLQVALNDEWRRCYASGRVAAPPGWRHDPHLGRFALAGEALAEMCSAETPAERAEGIGDALAAAAAAGDGVAARVMVQYMLPALVAAAWGAGLAGGSPQGEECDTLDAMVSTVWLALVTGEAMRGSTGVWTRLLRDAEYLVLQRPRRRAAREAKAVSRLAVVTREMADLAGRPDGVAVPPAEELLEVVCEAVAAGLGLADAQLLAELGVAGVAVTDAARADPKRVTARCVRWRRARAVRRVRVLTAEAA